MTEYVGTNKLYHMKTWKQYIFFQMYHISKYTYDNSL